MTVRNIIIDILINKGNDSLDIRLDLNVMDDVIISEFVITLHPEFEDELIRKSILANSISLKKGDKYNLNFDIEIPELKPYRYLIAITPIEDNGEFLVNRIKFIKFAILGHGIIDNHIDMKLKFNSFLNNLWLQRIIDNSEYIRKRALEIGSKRHKDDTDLKLDNLLKEFTRY